MATTRLLVLSEATTQTDGEFCGENCGHLHVPLTTVGPPVCKLLKQTLLMSTMVIPMRVHRACQDEERRALGQLRDLRELTELMTRRNG